MIQLKWFRIETGADGSILSCTEVEAKGRSGAVVRYYEAVSASKACDAAKEWAKARRERANARHKRIVSIGICASCGGSSRKGKCLCQGCADRRATLAKSLRLGRPLLTKRHASPVEAKEAYRASARASRRALGNTSGCIYRAILIKLDTKGPSKFRAWLVSEINRRSDAAHQIPTEEAQAAE